MNENKYMYIQDKTIFTCMYSIINGSYKFVVIVLQAYC